MPDISSTSSGDGDECNDEQDAQKDGKEDDLVSEKITDFTIKPQTISHLKNLKWTEQKKEQRHDPAPAEIGDAAKKFREIVSRHFLSLDL